MRWKIYQLSIFVSFLFANIYFDFGLKGIAAPIIGGMLSWYFTGLATAVVDLTRRARERRQNYKVSDQFDRAL